MADQTEHQGNTENHEGEAAVEETMSEAELAQARLEEEMELAEAAAKSGFSNPMEFLSAELDRLEAEKIELNNNFMRAHADMENLRRRTQKDVADARSFSIAGFAREMLAVADNLNRALEAVPAEAKASGDKGFETLIEGVELTQRAMVQALEKHGVKKITPLNERFDPNFHQAMFEIPNTEIPNNTVLQVVQDGFVIGNRCLRPAMVGVSKGGPKMVATEDNSPEQSGGASDEE